jgi:hypothetical protein
MDTATQHQDKALELKYALWGSFTLFCKTFFPLVTGRDFKLSSPVSRESHFTTIAKELTLVARMQSPSLLINVPPGSGKSTMLAMWVACTMSEYPDSQKHNISYGHELAAKHTEFIRRIIQCPHYQALFDITIRHDMKAKDHFVNNFGGSIKAFGSSGPITGQDGGLPGCDRFTGAVIMDDMHKPDEAHSDTIRHGVIKNYQETIVQRPRAPNVPMIFIGQRLHEDDLPAFFLSGKDERAWKSVVLQAIDAAGNALYPEVNPLSQLLEKKDKNPYVFSSQYQQEPVPAGGALFKERDFIILDEEPNILCTFITADTAETSKTYNDATVFSFWGLYKLSVNGQEIEHYGLHWLDCWEIRIEPKELETQFKSFYWECMLHKVKPLIAAIEKKSAGVTLCSVLEDLRGIEIHEVKRDSTSSSKSNRYIQMQPWVGAKLISFTYGAKHIRLCVEHMTKITANGSHRHDDICDTVYDAIRAGLMDKALFVRIDKKSETARNASKLNAAVFNQRQAAIKAARGY